MKSGILNGIAIVLFVIGVQSAFILFNVGSNQSEIEGLIGILAVMISGYVFKRRTKVSFNVFNISESTKLFHHAFGIALVFVLAMLPAGMLNDILSINKYGLFLSIILIPLITGAQWLNIIALMVFGGLFYKIKGSATPLNEKLALIATYSDLSASQIAVDVLQENGVPAYQQNQFTSSMWANSVESINIQVPVEFKAKAEVILKELDMK